MGLSPLIEKALALERPGGGYLAQMAETQMLIPYFAPQVSLNVEIGPPAGTFAAIAFEVSAAEIYPYAFSLVLRNYGQFLLNLTVPPGGRSFVPFDLFILATERNPYSLTITNTDTVGHPWSNIMGYIVIPTQDDLIQLLDRLGTTLKGSQELRAIQGLAAQLELDQGPARVGGLRIGGREIS